MTPKAAFWKWALIGLVAASILLVVQARELGGLTGLLQVGESSQLRPLIEAQLGDVPLTPGRGHDGQGFYAIALDLTGENADELMDHAGYRYRRILGPALASVFGLLQGHAVLVMMIVISLLSAAVAAGSVGAAARALGLSDWVALAVVLNPGMWLSVRLLTPDVLALALMCLGLYGVALNSRWAVGAFALSGLAKEIVLLTPAGVALSGPRRRWQLLFVPVLTLAAWGAWVTVSIGPSFTGRGNVGLPFVGLVTSSQNWANLGAGDVLYLVFALASVAAAVILGLIRGGWLRWSLLGWGVLGVITSDWVWDFGNNAARVFAPIVILVVLSLGSLPASRDRDAETPHATVIAGSRDEI